MEVKRKIDCVDRDTDGTRTMYRPLIWCANACARIPMRLYTNWKIPALSHAGFFCTLYVLRVHGDFIHLYNLYDGTAWILFMYTKWCRFPCRFDKLTERERMQRCNGSIVSGAVALELFNRLQVKARGSEVKMQQTVCEPEWGTKSYAERCRLPISRMMCALENTHG